MAENYFEDIVNINMENGQVNRSFSCKLLGEGDSKANIFGVRLFRNGEPLAIQNATVVGYFIKPNGTTVVIDDAAADGNKYTVTIPQTCYTDEGTFTLSIKLITTDRTTTVRIVDGTIIKESIGDFIDPGSVIPDLEEYLALAEQIEEAAEAIEAFSISSSLISGTRYKAVIETS